LQEAVAVETDTVLVVELVVFFLVLQQLLMVNTLLPSALEAVQKLLVPTLQLQAQYL
jgi:hypothetical protein